MLKIVSKLLILAAAFAALLVTRMSPAAAVVPKVLILNDIVLTIGTDNYEASVKKVRLVPTTPVAKWKGMTPGSVVNVAGDPEWVMELAFAQDHDTATSMSLYLAANVGTEKTITLKPKKPASGTAPLYTVKVLILPGPIGGDLDSVAEGDVSLPVNGQPVRTVA